MVLSTLVLDGTAQAQPDAPAPHVLLEAGRDFPETRFFSVCPVRCSQDAQPIMAVAGFTNNGDVDVADLATYEVRESSLDLRWRLMRGTSVSSSIRTLRSADLDQDGCEELVALGRIGNEELDSRAELQVFRLEEDHWQRVASQRWQSGQYTHGYGMALGDVTGDGRPEIVTGGFFADSSADGREQAELRVWRLVDNRLAVVAATSWGADIGHTRINAVCVGDVAGNGRPQIITAGRTGQVQSEPEVNTHEADQLIVWNLDTDKLVQRATYAAAVESRSRFRELKLADIDGQPGLELLAVGRHEPAVSDRPRRGRGDGSGGGRGDGSGGGRGDGTGGGRGRHRAAEGGGADLHPLFEVLKVRDSAVERITSADFGDSRGEVRDVAIFTDAANATQIVTITANELKPQRNAALDRWRWSEGSLRADGRRVAELGDETRARQLIVWNAADQPRILTIGFVHRDDRILGQILDWGSF